MENLIQKIEQLKKEKDAVILAHYYVADEIQAVADYVGDSFYLSKIATTIPQQVICFAGVSFMGESAKILNPEKTVLLPEPSADCAMAHMVDLGQIQKMRELYEDLAVVCYINSTAEIKEYADVCVTSANAQDIVEKLPNQYIYFIPDGNLGRHIASKVKDKTFIFNDGYCPVHKEITKEKLLKAKERHPSAKVLAHPECTMDVLELADYIGSTSGIIRYAGESGEKEFIIATEQGIFYELHRNNPDKQFYPVYEHQCCEDMKKITLEKIASCLNELAFAVEVPEEHRIRANIPLNKMLELGK